MFEEFLVAGPSNGCKMVFIHLSFMVVLSGKMNIFCPALINGPFLWGKAATVTKLVEKWLLINRTSFCICTEPNLLLIAQQCNEILLDLIMCLLGPRGPNG